MSKRFLTCTPILSLFTPAAMNALSFSSSNVPGSISTEISAPDWIPKHRSSFSRRRSSSLGGRRDGVPPPKKIVRRGSKEAGSVAALVDSISWHTVST